jgi:ribonuclease HI
MNPTQQDAFSPAEIEQEPIHVFVDGAGARFDGKGSAYAFVRPDTGEKQVIREDGLTNNQAEYMGIILALETFPKGCAVEIRTDSEVVCAQLNGRYKVRDPKLALLLETAKEVIQRNNLKAQFVWIPRAENLAGKLL